MCVESSAYVCFYGRDTLAIGGKEKETAFGGNCFMLDPRVREDDVRKPPSAGAVLCWIPGATRAAR